jgi:hypothetical protein
MVSTVVFERAGGKGSLVSGLEWNVLSVGKKVNAQIRELAKGDASHFARVVSTQREEVRTKRRVVSVRKEAAGLYTSLDGKAPARNTHSLAAAFAAWTREHPRALLNVQVENERWVVVVVVNGHPVLDRVESSADAAAAICKSYLEDGQEISVFSDQRGKYPDSLVHDDLIEHIWSALSEQTRLKTVPRDVVLLVVVTLVACAVAGGGFFYMKKEQERKRQEALQRQRDADPVPKYLNALAAAREAVGVDRAAIKAGIDFAMRTPLTPDGWNASRISCVQGGACEVRYTRTTGTFKGLQSAVGFLTLAPAAEVNLNEARMTWQQPMAASKLDVATQLPQMASFIQGAEASKLQDWLVAGLTIQVSPPRLWPQAEGVPDSFKHPQALAAGKFEIDSIAVPQMLEAVSNAPANVIWTGWSIDISDAKGEPLNRGKGHLTGNFYVTNAP